METPNPRPIFTVYAMCVRTAQGVEPVAVYGKDDIADAVRDFGNLHKQGYMKEEVLDIAVRLVDITEAVYAAVKEVAK